MSRNLERMQYLICICSKHSQVSELVRGDDDAREPAGVLDDGDAVDLLEALVDDARAAHVREARRPPVALADARLPPAHVQPERSEEHFVELIRNQSLGYHSST